MDSHSGIDPRSGYCEATGIYYSKRKPLDFPQQEFLSLPAFVAQKQHSGTVAFIDYSTGRHLSYNDFWVMVRSLSAGLASLGIKKSDVVLLLSPNSISFPVVCMAVFSVGAIITTANPLNTTAEIARQVRDSGAKIAFAVPELASKVSLPTVLITEAVEVPQSSGGKFVATLQGLIAGFSPDDAPVVRIRQDDVATLLYSSGTTGMSKGVISTHRNHISLVSILLARLGFNGKTTKAMKETFLCTVPMFHIYGLVCFACGLLASGSNVVVLTKFELLDMLKAMQKHKVTYLPVVPPIVLALTKTNAAKKFDLSSLHTVLCGGAPLSKEATEDFISQFPGVTIMQGYGLTETVGVGSSTDTQEESRHYGTAGMLSPNMQAKVVDPDSGLEMRPNQKGELWLRGPVVMKGYFSNPEATTTALDSQGWLRTGDLCYIDAVGYIFIVDRIKELIKYKGYQVAPAELEALLHSHPDIVEAAVIPFPDREAGQIPMAYVVRKPGSQLSEAGVIDFVAKQVAPYKKIRRVSFVKEIPKTTAGKLLRKDLIKLATSKATSKL